MITLQRRSGKKKKPKYPISILNCDNEVFPLWA